ncbi:uncharacterized protein LOC115589967 isoform X8 [Sparus aurata]|uniref:uncharacterized protein LOC115589967 isoform X8 n=1 Tax=Sparus aurata TaxID=8175 RepID=UPI0011C1BF91|nr:uncharacterized protein LOC115589967 isoform X8 [Sparus aurata]
MSKVQILRSLVKQRLTAAAEEICALFERTIAEYEEELCRSTEQNQRHRNLLDSALTPQLRLHRAGRGAASICCLSKPVGPLQKRLRQHSKQWENNNRAAEWVETNQHLFSGKVELPDAVQMGEEELAEAAQQYARLWVEEESADMDDQEREDILEPFRFLFSNIEHMWTFSEEMSDKQGYL